MQRKQGYHYLRETLAHVMRFAAWVRIDHMPALHRLFLIPYGAKPADGVYVRYAHEDQYAIYALESHRRRVRLAGEDMGTLPEDLRPSMLTHKIDRIFAAQYQPPVAGNAVEGTPTANSIAGMSTHDLATFAAFWRGLDISDRLELGLVTKPQANIYTRHREKLRRDVSAILNGQSVPSPKATLITRSINFLLRKLGIPPRPLKAWDEADEFDVLKKWLALIAGSDASLALVNVEDLWLSVDPQNVPSTTTQRPNWRHRAHHELEQFDRIERINEAIAILSLARPTAIRKAA